MAVYGLRRRTPMRHEFNVTGGASAPTIEPGDLLYYDGTTLKPLSAFTWDTSEAITRKAAMPRFVGVSNFDWNSTNNKFNRTMQVEHGAVFEMGFSGSGIPKVGTLLGFSSASSLLKDQTLVKVKDVRDAVGYCVKDYSSAPSTILCALFSSFDLAAGLASRIHTIQFPCSAALVSAGGNIVNGYVFGKRVKITNASATLLVAISVADITVTLKNGANAIDDTLVIANSGSAAGGITFKTIDDSSGYDFFAAKDTLVAAVSSGTTSATSPCFTLTIEYMDIPFLVDA